MLPLILFIILKYTTDLVIFGQDLFGLRYSKDQKSSSKNSIQYSDM